MKREKKIGRRKRSQEKEEKEENKVRKIKRKKWIKGTGCSPHVETFLKAGLGKKNIRGHGQF